MIRYAGISVTGRKENGVNDDRILINGRIADTLEGEADSALLAVMDGVGGAAYGDEAAQLAAETLMRLDGGATAESITAAVAQANHAILAARRQDAEHAGMATTVAGIALDGRNYTVFNLGDSRVYHLSYFFSQLTRDHTYLRMMQDAMGVDVQVPPERMHVITRCLGSQDGDEPELLAGENIVRPGDMFLLCSDGLHDVLTDETMAGMLREGADNLPQLCRALIDAALAAGSRDNISAIVARVEESA